MAGVADQRRAAEVALRQATADAERLRQDEAHLRRHFRTRRITVEQYRQMAADTASDLAAALQREACLRAWLGALWQPATIDTLVQSLAPSERWDSLAPVQRKRVLSFFVHEIVVRYPAKGEPACAIWWKVTG